MSSAFIQVLIDGPLAGSFSYRCPANSESGAVDGASPAHRWVTVPWGKGRRTGLALAGSESTTPPADLAPDSIREIEAYRDDLPSPSPAWLKFMQFVAAYYHGNLPDLVLGNLPKLLRAPPTERSRTDARKRLAAFSTRHALKPREGLVPGHESQTEGSIVLNEAQQQVLDALCASDTDASREKTRPWLLHGITGSGKTEVYLHWMAHLLKASPEAQVLLLVPEIGLTPAVQQQLQRRFPDETIAVLHSEMTDAARASHWLAAASGTARIVLGTRLAALTPIPHLCAIIVDEEHDPSYKQQEGLRYSARDMAVARASQAGLPILLGSATPSLESWHNAHLGRYRLLSMTQRARSHITLPSIQIVPLRGRKTHEGLADESLEAIQQTLVRQEQALLFLNRRGYAPVLSCDACGWLSTCDRCAAYRVLHRQPSPAPSGAPRYHLICHHCGFGQAVPRACPDCGNQDLAPLGRGTQKLEDALGRLFPRARIGRLDADVARRKGATEAFLASVHAGETDILVGTQMLAKGHDFDRLTLVVVVDADAGLFTTNFRAPERLFATLMQVAGRAGRHRVGNARTLIQTRHPEHPLFAALTRHDYPAFARNQLEERQQGGLPPFGYQALLLAQARDMESALGFLNDSREYLLSISATNYDHGGNIIQHSASISQNDKLPDHLSAVQICDPVPMPLAQINKICRAQLLIESPHRPSLHALISRWQRWADQSGQASRAGKAGTRRNNLQWQWVIDPQEI